MLISALLALALGAAPAAAAGFKYQDLDSANNHGGLGRAGMIFQPHDVSYVDGVSQISFMPNARVVSNALMGRAPDNLNNHGVAALVAAWGQFVGKSGW